MKKIRTFAKIISKKEIAENTSEIELSLEEKINFRAGQYITITLPQIKTEDPRINKRDFSICSSPSEDNLKITFRNSKSEFKQKILSLSTEEKIIIEGPKGIFVLQEGFDKDVVLIAGGVGITPFMSMMTFLTEEDSKQKIKLIYANTEDKRAAYLGEIDELVNQNENIKAEKVFGVINEGMVKRFVSENPNSIWYLCGVSEMVSSIREALVKEGVSERNIKFESFTGY